jgi:hypothetical protein
MCVLMESAVPPGVGVVVGQIIVTLVVKRHLAFATLLRVEYGTLA